MVQKLRIASPVPFFVAAFCVIFGSWASAHELWLEPHAYQLAPGDELMADLKNGEAFKGTTLGYFPGRSSRFDITLGDTTQPVTGRMGDTPAVAAPTDQPGLAVIAHETAPSTIRYKTWEKFAKFAAHKDFAEIEARHQAAGFPREGFAEIYTRHVKALVAIGDGNGADRELGLATEFVALTNPYAPGFDGTMQVALFDQGAPRADTQVEVFDRAPSGEVTITLYRTDGSGTAEIPVTPGHTYLFDAVVLRPYAGDKDAVWETLWAALTFAVPD